MYSCSRLCRQYLRARCLRSGIVSRDGIDETIIFCEDKRKKKKRRNEEITHTRLEQLLRQTRKTYESIPRVTYKIRMILVCPGARPGARVVFVVRA